MIEKSCSYFRNLDNMSKKLLSNKKKWEKERDNSGSGIGVSSMLQHASCPENMVFHFITHRHFMGHTWWSSSSCRADSRWAGNERRRWSHATSMELEQKHKVRMAFETPAPSSTLTSSGLWSHRERHHLCLPEDHQPDRDPEQYEHHEHHWVVGIHYCVKARRA